MTILCNYHKGNCALHLSKVLRITNLLLAIKWYHNGRTATALHSATVFKLNNEMRKTKGERELENT